MIPDSTLVWTKRGYSNIADLTPGDKVLSYNQARGCTEYDQIGSIKTEWMQQGLIGLKQCATDLLLTPDHPLLIINPKTKELSRIAINDLFMRNGGKFNKLLTNKAFEPYKRTHDIEDVKWVARLAVSSCRFRIPPLYQDVIEELLKDITGYEAQVWLNTFFHWGILRSRTQYMKTCMLRNQTIRDMLYHVAPRAGVGTYYGPFKTKAKHHLWQQAFSIAKQGNTNIVREHWCQNRHVGIFYTLSTKNGNFVGKQGSCTIPVACDYS